MDCNKCQRALGPEQRRGMGCGYVEPSARTGVFKLQQPGKHPEDLDYDVCPGWLVTLPQVTEAARASGWRNDLKQFYSGQNPTPVLMDGIDVFCHEIETVKLAAIQGAGDDK